jgi:ABC-2 type transport system permease protein
MKEFFSLLVARNKEFYRDRGTLGWNFVFPFLIVLGFAFGYSGDPQNEFKVGIYRDPSATVTLPKEFLDTKYIEFIPIDNLTDAIQKVSRHQIHLLLASGPELQMRYWINASSQKGYVVEKILKGTTTNLIKQEVEGRQTRYVDWLVPGILSMNIMFSSLFGVGYVLVRYRKNGVLKRFKATPIRAFSFLTAQVVSRLILIMTTASIFIFGSYFLIHFEMRGSWLTLFLFLAVGSTCMISLGLIVASRVASEELAEGLLNLLTWPMMFLSGIWFSLEGASPIVRYATQIFPLTHIVNGARAIILDGATLASLTPEIAMLGLLSVIFLTIGSLVFRWN